MILYLSTPEFATMLAFLTNESDFSFSEYCDNEQYFTFECDDQEDSDALEQYLTEELNANGFQFFTFEALEIA